ncbi:MAG TPA: Arm DNA-binding domain-containing protein [Chitinophagaceae bacterium]
MLDKSFGLLFYLKKPKNYLKGAIPIYLRITVDGVPKEISIKRSWDAVRWNSDAGRASGTKEDSKTSLQLLSKKCLLAMTSEIKC